MHLLAVAFDFSKYYGKGYDEIVFAIQTTISHLIDESSKSNKLSPATLVNYCVGGVTRFLTFCELVAAAFDRELLLSDISKNLIDRYLSFLAEGTSKVTSQKAIFAQLKSVMIAMVKLGLLKADKRHIFPRNPHPNLKRAYKGKKPLSSKEMGRVSQALAKELRQIKQGTEPLNSYEAIVCMLAISMRTGINPTPLVDLSCDCLQPHPLKTDRKLLISFKRRGVATHITPIRNSEELSLLNTVMMDVAAMIEMVSERNRSVREASGTSKLWAIQREHRNACDHPTLVSFSNLSNMIIEFSQRNSLLDDDGKPLVLNLSRLRKSYINRIWGLSGQDPIVTAAMGNHSLNVSNNHYLDAPPEAEKNFSLLGEIRVKELLEKDSDVSISNTPVAQCKDSLNGHRAPKNGEHCTDFLSCFRCKSFVVTKDDLYRVYSLYWLLISERNAIGTKRWSRFYSHIIRIIDNDIATKFEAGTVKDVKAMAKEKPHLYWKSNEVLIGGVS